MKKKFKIRFTISSRIYRVSKFQTGENYPGIEQRRMRYIIDFKFTHSYMAQTRIECELT